MTPIKQRRRSAVTCMGIATAWLRPGTTLDRPSVEPGHQQGWVIAKRRFGNGSIVATTITAAASEPEDSRPRLMIDGEPVIVTNFRATLPTTSEVKDRVGLVKAAINGGLNLDEDGLHAVARALTDPRAAAAAVREDLLLNEIVGPASLRIVQGYAYLPELLVLIQPRAGAVASAVAPPVIVGHLGADGLPEAMVTVRFRDEVHLVEYIAQTVRQTRTMGRDYTASIITKRVSRPVLAHAARIEFDDGSEPFVVTMVRDGLTRVVSSWAAIHPDLSVDELAAVIAEALLAAKRGRKTDDTETSMRARGRGIVLQELRARFQHGLVGGEPTEDAIRIGQSLTLPVQMVLSLDQIGTPGVAADQQFDDAVQALVGSVHGEFQPWEASASDAAAIQRALPRAVHDGILDVHVAQMALGHRPVAEVPKVFGEKYPATALWRAICLVAWLCDVDEFAAVKRHLRELLGLSKIHKGTYVGNLMTLVDLPWRHGKIDTRQQAYRAWTNGSPIPHEIIGVSWWPVATTDFTTLVPKALAGDDEARYTLQVAGGIALVADKLLLSNTGSALSGARVPFRSNVNDVVTGLGRPDNEAGLWLLARAANAFRPDRRAINSFTAQELLRKPPGPDCYIVPAVDPKQPSLLPTDAAGQVKRLTAYDVVYLSDPERAEQEAEEAEKTSSKSGPTETNAAKAARMRTNVVKQLKSTRQDLNNLVAMAAADVTLNPVLGDMETWEVLQQAVAEITSVLYTNKPPAPTLFDFDDELPDEDEQDLG
ncbi:hypothetical protein [Micromonospora tulbaghiae]